MTSVLPAASLALACVLGVAWVVRLAAIIWFTRQREVLHPRSHPARPPNPPRVSIVLAAKDEEANIEACVLSLLEQDYPDFELIVVNDRSRDQSGSILERLRAANPRKLQVVTVGALRDGWFGKNNAMREGVSASCGEWLLFTDADCRFVARNTLTIAMSEALAHQSDFLSVLRVMNTQTAWERILHPVCGLYLLLWFLPFKVNDPARRTAYADGAFMLMRRTCYQTIGGHEAVRTQLNEDTQMARVAKKAGLRLRVIESEGLIHTRMYPTPAAAWRGWSRIFAGCLKTSRRLLITAGLVVFYALTPWLGMIASLVGAAVSDTTTAVRAWLWSAAAWSVVVFLVQAAIWRVYRITGVRPIWSLSYPLGAAATLGIVLNALAKVVGASSVTWRGTTYLGSTRIGSQTEPDGRVPVPGTPFEGSTAPVVR